MITTITADDYQIELEAGLISDLAHNGLAVLQAPTGCGKTPIMRIVAHRLREANVIRGVLVAVPLNHIKEGWTNPLHILFPEDKDSLMVNLPLTIRQGEWQQRLKRTRNERQETQKWLTARSPSPFGRLISHHGLARWGQTPGFLPDDLTGLLLVVDEGHHLANKTGVGKVAASWHARGGLVVSVSATPRVERFDLLKEIVPVYRGMTEHMSSGKYAPQHLSIRTQIGSFKSQSTRVLLGTQMPSQTSEAKAFIEGVHQLWISQNKPKALVLVPAGASLEWARYAEQVFSKDARVHVAVGRGRARDLEDLLRRERQAVALGIPSEVDVIIACRRFDEATNWPWCSHIYKLGLPYKIHSLVQIIGRATRYKGGHPESLRPDLVGYDPAHRNTASVTLFLPQHKNKGWKRYLQLHTDHAFLVAAYLRDSQTGDAFMEPLRQAVESARRKSRPDTKAVWSRIAQTIQLTVEETKMAFSLMKRASLRCGDAPTDDELKTTMQALGASEDQVEHAFLARDLRFRIGSTRVIASLEAKVSQVVRKGRLIKPHLQQIFDQVVVDTTTINSKLRVEAKAEMAILSDFTGQDVEAIERALFIRWRSIKDPLVLIRQASIAFFQEKGRAPQGLDGDSFPWSNLHVSWASLISKARETGNSPFRMLLDEGLVARRRPYPAYSLDDVRAAITKFGRHPSVGSKKDAVDYGFPFSITWEALHNTLKSRFGLHLRDISRELGLPVQNRRATPARKANLKEVEQAFIEFIQTHGKTPPGSVWFESFSVGDFSVGALQRYHGPLIQRETVRRWLEETIERAVEEATKAKIKVSGDPHARINFGTGLNSLGFSWARANTLLKKAGSDLRVAALSRKYQQPRPPRPPRPRPPRPPSLGMDDLEAALKAHIEANGMLAPKGKDPIPTQPSRRWHAFYPVLAQQGLTITSFFHQRGLILPQQYPFQRLSRKDVLALFDSYTGDVRPCVADLVPDGSMTWSAVAYHVRKHGLKMATEWERRGVRSYYRKRTMDQVRQALSSYMADHEGQLPDVDITGNTTEPYLIGDTWIAVRSWARRRGYPNLGAVADG